MKNILTIIVCAALACVSCVQPDRYITITGYAQGGTYTVKLNLNGRDGMVDASPEEIRDSVDAILRKIDNSLSGYNRNSTLSRFNSGETVIPDPLFIEIYGDARRFFDLTDGAVDVASAPLFDMWGFGFKSGEMPDEAMIARTLAGSGLNRLAGSMQGALAADGTLSPHAMLKHDDMPVDKSDDVLPQLNYNAIAQGYSCDKVAEYLYGLGVKDMMVDIGEIFCDGVNPNGFRWTIGIDRPSDGNDRPGADLQGIFRVPDGPHGVVTSGNYRKFYVRDGKKYAHTIDPVTGRPVEHNLLSATVVAPDAMTADAYATYCMVVGLEQAMKFIESDEMLEGCLVYDDGGTFATWCSSGFLLEQ